MIADQAEKTHSLSAHPCDRTDTAGSESDYMIHGERSMQRTASRFSGWLTASTAATILAASSIVLILLGAVAPGLSFPFSFDEAYNLALARNLASTGQYAVDIYGTPLRWFDPYVTTGPTVTFPLALVMKAFGTDTSILRAVLFLFLALFLASAYLAARWQSSWLGGAITVVLFGLLSYDLYDLGLRILGEVPSLALLFLSIAALAGSSGWRWFLGGIFLALALLTKPQMGIAVVACIAVWAVLGLSKQQRALTPFLPSSIGFLAPLVGWNLYQIAAAGPISHVKHDVESTDIDLLQHVSLGQMVLTPSPKEGILDQDHGKFIYPTNRNMLRGLTMISPAKIETRDLEIKDRQALFLGYSPPSLGDGVLLSIFINDINDGAMESKIWSEYVPAAEPSPENYRVRLISLSDYSGKRATLTVKASSEATGDEIADWLFISPLAIVSQK